MNKEECIKFLFDSYVIEEVVSGYIENLENTERFASCFIVDFAARGKDFSFNFAEVFDSENIDVKYIELKNNNFYVKFELNYLLSIWKRIDKENRQQLARITATAEGECTFENKDEIEEKDIKLIKLNNIMEEYEDTSML